MAKSLTDRLLGELESEATITRRVLERVPEGKGDWKPHEKSMPMGRLAGLVATMPGWIAMMLTQDEFDVTSGGMSSTPTTTKAELLSAFDAAVARSREALKKTNDAHLETNWRMLARGHVVAEASRYENLRSGVLNHLAHHRGQLTVYLRLNDVPVPSVYGPTADEAVFG
ncbi:MAG TPA: DinB family protein [Gemmatimonadaceae bacterium]|nr:DinB family protein [Gemmatimonadaceae bacterium]